MKQADLSPEKVGIWNPGGVKAHTLGLDAIVKKEGWENIPRVPVFELPEGLMHSHVLVDGHGRHAAAQRTNTLLPCNIYEFGERIDVVKDVLAPFTYSSKASGGAFYHKIMTMYLHYEKHYRT